MTPDEEDPVSTPDVFTAAAQLWISGKTPEAFFQLIKVQVSLCLASLSEAVCQMPTFIATWTRLEMRFRTWCLCSQPSLMDASVTDEYITEQVHIGQLRIALDCL